VIRVDVVEAVLGDVLHALGELGLRHAGAMARAAAGDRERQREQDQADFAREEGSVGVHGVLLWVAGDEPRRWLEQKVERVLEPMLERDGGSLTQPAARRLSSSQAFVK